MYTVEVATYRGKMHHLAYAINKSLATGLALITPKNSKGAFCKMYNYHRTLTLIQT
jgi:hypothetical protein